MKLYETEEEATDGAEVKEEEVTEVTERRKK